MSKTLRYFLNVNNSLKGIFTASLTNVNGVILMVVKSLVNRTEMWVVEAEKNKIRADLWS